MAVDMLIRELCCFGKQHGFGSFNNDFSCWPIEPAMKIAKITRTALRHMIKKSVDFCEEIKCLCFLLYDSEINDNKCLSWIRILQQLLTIFRKKCKYPPVRHIFHLE